jgi:hypothetical protein
MKALFLSLLLGLFQASAYAQPTALFKSYLRDAMDTNLSNLALADKYFCTVHLHRTNQDGEWIRQRTDAWLAGQRKYLWDKQVKLNEVEFILYDSLTAEQRPAKPFHMMGETSHTYVALYQGQIACFFLFKDNRIVSTILLGMGREHSFVDYCATE